LNRSSPPHDHDEQQHAGARDEREVEQQEK
jgi:hypothetical protein